MRADPDRADDELGTGIEDGADPLHLDLEGGELAPGESAQGLDGDGHAPAGAFLVPDATDLSVEQQYGKVPGLAPGQRAFRGPAREEAGPRLRPDLEGIEVRQQPDLGCRRRVERGVATPDPRRLAVEVDLIITSVPESQRGQYISTLAAMTASVKLLE